MTRPISEDQRAALAPSAPSTEAVTMDDVIKLAARLKPDRRIRYEVLERDAAGEIVLGRRV